MIVERLWLGKLPSEEAEEISPDIVLEIRNPGAEEDRAPPTPGSPVTLTVAVAPIPGCKNEDSDDADVDEVGPAGASVGLYCTTDRMLRVVVIEDTGETALALIREVEVELFGKEVNVARYTSCEDMLPVLVAETVPEPFAASSATCMATVLLYTERKKLLA